VATDAAPVSIMGMGTVARVLRGLVVVLIIAASVQAYGRNFFFYFTILSNLLAVVLLGGQALWPDWMRSNAFLRGGVTLFMTMTGLVYAVVLAPLGVSVGGYAPWANFVHHNLAPTAVLIDWLLFPPRQKLRTSASWLWLIFPVVYFAFTVLRGSGNGFYPYPFLNPDNAGGTGGVVLYAAVILAVFAVVGWFIRWWADNRGIIPGRDGLTGSR
jgi:hypothetical protein